MKRIPKLVRRSLPACGILASCLLSSTLYAQLPTNGMLLWLDATDPSTLFQDDLFTVPAANGNPIGGWKDKSGNNYHATQSNDDQRPERADGVMDGDAAVRFFGADGDGMAISEDLTLTRPYTAFIVNQYHGATRGRTLQGLDSNWLLGLWSGAAGHYAEGWVGQVPRVPEDFVMVAETLGDDASSSFMVNGVDYATDINPKGNPGRLGLVSVGMFPGEVSDADISEILIYDHILNDTDLTSVRTYLNSKYNPTPVPPPPPQNRVSSGQIGVFTGGDPGEGLDMAGEFVYALDVGGPGGVTVGNANFTDASILGIDSGESPGVEITVANEILDWHAPDYGTSDADLALADPMRSIRWNVPPGVNVDLDVAPGTYQLQMLFAESCCNRGFDILVEDELAVDDFNVQELQGGINVTTQGAYFRDTVVVTDGTLSIFLKSDNPGAPDNNPILNALTLERLGPPTSPGDFNADGVLDAADIDALSAQVRSGTFSATYDVNSDTKVDDADRQVWVDQLKKTYMGDANLDGQFNSTDLVGVFQVGEYEDATNGNSGWADGDFSGDGDFNSTDFVVAFQAGGYDQGPRAAVSAVPEPATGGLAVLALSMLGLIRRRSR